MLQPRKWWIGLPPLAILFILAATLNTDTIEKDIGDRVRAALASDSRAIDNPQVAVAGRDVTVSGVTLSKDATANLLESVERQAGVRAVTDATAAPPIIAPFVFSLERKDGKLAFTGYAPATGEREKIRAAAKSKGLEIADSVFYASGAPKNFDALASYGLTLLTLLGNGKVAFADATLSVSGAAANAEIYESALAALKAPPAGAVVKAADIRPPPVSPFVWSAAKTGDAIVLSGYAPSAEIRDILASKAAGVAADIANRISVASGAPAGDFAAAASVALAELAKLTQGKASLDGPRLSIEGAGKPNVTPSEIEASARAALPKEFALGPIDVAAGIVSPYRFSARKDGATLTLSGYVPDADARAKIVARAKRGFDAEIVDRVVIADGAPEGFADAAIATLRALARLNSGAADIKDSEIALEGSAFHAKAPPEIAAQLANRLPKGFKSATRIDTEPVGEPIDRRLLHGVLSEIVARGISFSNDNSSIDIESAPVVDALALALRRSPDVTIGISGHTDNFGSEAENEDISRRRAQTVLDYLVRAGVDPTRLTATGFGAARPIASNDSDNGRAQNRRIEFSIK